MPTIQAELQIFETPVEKPRRIYTVDAQIIRSAIWRHQREGRPVYHPRSCRAQILSILSDNQWHGFVELSRKIDMGASAVSHIVDFLERHNYLEKREHYYGAEPMMPEVRPAEYRGFQYAYRLRQTPPNPTNPIP